MFACHVMHGGGDFWKAIMNGILLSVFPSNLRVCHVFQYIITSENCVPILYIAVFIISAATVSDM